MTFWQMFYSVGSFIAYWVRYACARNATKLGNWDWRMVIIFQLLVPILIVAQVLFIPESPRWYIQKGNQVEKARESLRKVRRSEDEVNRELDTIIEAIAYEKETMKGSAYSALWNDPSVRKRLLIAFALNAGQQVTGQGTLNTYSSIIYQKIFSGSTIDLINALNATLGIFFTLNAIFTDRFGRKVLFIIGAIGMGVCMLIVATVGTETPYFDMKTHLPTDDRLKGTKSRPVAIAITFILFLFTLFCKILKYLTLLMKQETDYAQINHPGELLRGFGPVRSSA
jgi:MFS family permease